MRLENELTKNQILEDYLNLVPFGNNAFGIEVAAERYFNETMIQLTLPQAALLAGLGAGAVARSTRSRTRPKPRPPPRHVLQAMVDTHKITAAQATRRTRRRCPTRVFYPRRRSAATTSTRSLDQLRSRTPTSRRIPANVLGKTRAAAHKRLYEGGLRIYTNYDPVTQYDREPRDLRHRSRRTRSQFTGGARVDRQQERRGARGGVRARLRREPVRSRRSTDRAGRPDRRSRASRSRRRSRTATRPTTG